MPKQRAEIAMTPEEQRVFLEEGFSLQVASIGPHGYPHQVTMWYGVVDGLVFFQTRRKSQKVLNLRRNPKISVLVEAGTEYDQLRGLVIEGNAELVEDPDEIVRLMKAIGPRYAGRRPSGRQVESDEARRAEASKRIGIRVHPVRVYSWDHRKLAGPTG